MAKGEEDDTARSADDKALKARLDKLSNALETQRQGARIERKEADIPGGETGRALSLGFRVLSEFVAGVVVGGLIGWQLDRWLSTTPAFLIVFLTLGTAAGFWNVYRIASGPAMTDRPGNREDPKEKS